MQALFLLAGVLVTTLGGIAVAVISARQKATETLIATLQQEIERGREVIAEHGDRIEVLEVRDRLLTDYALMLRQHIIDGFPPPPPPWPTGLNP
jgi:hypothetical protein